MFFNIHIPPTLDSRVQEAFLYESLAKQLDTHSDDEHAPWLSMNTQSCQQGGMGSSEGLNGMKEK